MFIHLSLFLIFIRSIINDEIMLPFQNVEYFNISENNKIWINTARSIDIIVNIFSINCEININTNTNEKIYKDNQAKITHSFNNDSFSIRKDKYRNTEYIFEIQPIKEIFHDYKTCHLIANTFSRKDYKLNFEGNGPTVFFFR